MNKVQFGKSIICIFGFVAALTITSRSFAQTTYYSRNDAVNLPRQWDDVDSWTTNADGSGPPAAFVPQQIDHVVILSGHSITVNGTANNGGPATSADGLGQANVGAGGTGNTFPDSNTPNFYQTGDVSVESSGSLIVSVRSMFGGTTFVNGSFATGADIINLGEMFFTSLSSFQSNDDLILSGFSNTRIDIPTAASAFTNDDIYLDHLDAWLCGLGEIEVDVNNTGGIINLNNLATHAQICSNLTIIGCSSGSCVGTGTFTPNPPALALSGAGTDLTYIENAVTQINPAMALTYGDLFLSSATVSLDATYVNGEDVLAMIPISGINASFDTGSGTLNITGYGSISTWEAALQNVTYENLSDNPSTSTRTASFQITDGFIPSNVETRDIIITPVNDPPDVSTLSGTPTPLSYTEGDGAVPVDDEIEVADPDDLNLEGAIITISTAFQAGEDVLAFTNTANITGLFVGNVMTLSGTAPIAEYQAALRAITYENTSEDPDETTRTVGFQVDDGDVVTPIPFTRDIEITAVNDPPVITSTAPPTATEDVLYTYTAMVTDPDDANNGTDITWTLSNEPAGMVVSTVGVVTWTPAEGVLTSGLVTLSVEDGDEDISPPDTEDFTITVTPVNDPPVISSTAPPTATEDVLYTYTAMVTDPDDANNGTDITWTLANEPAGMVVSTVGVVTWTPAEGVLTSGLVTLSVEDGDEDISPPDTEDFTITVTPVNDPPVITSTAPPTATEDVLYTYTAMVTDPDDANNGTDITWTLSNEPTGMIVSSTGVVTWTPLEGVLTSGLVTLSVEDGDEDISPPDTEDFTITVTPVNDPPMITSTAPGSATEETLYTYTPTVVDPDDANNGTDITWTLSNEPAGMVVSSTGVVTWTPAEGVLTSGLVTLSVEDGDEDISPPDTEDFTITVTPVNDPPVITSTAPPTATEDVLYTYAAMVTDPDDANNGTDITWTLSNEPAGMVVSSTGVVTWTPLEGVLTSGLVTLSVEDGDEDISPPDTEDFTITVTPVNDPPVITSTAPGSATEETLYTYTPTVVDPDDANNGTDITWTLSNEPAGMVVSTVGVVTWTPLEGVLTSGLVTLSVEDGDEDISPPDTEDFTITVTPVNDPPVITSSVTLITYTEGDGTVLMATDATISDNDDTQMESASIAIATNFASGEDVLGFIDQSGIAGNFNSGVLSLTGTATLADYEIAIQSITYENTSSAPVTATRTITFEVNDGDNNSLAISIDIQIVSLPEPPVIQPHSGSGIVDYTENEGPKILVPDFTLSDLDDTNLEGAVVIITNNISSEDALGFNDQNGISGSFDGSTGILTLSGSAALLDYQAAIRSITYENTSDDPDVTSRTVDHIVNDGESNSNTLTLTINILSVNDAPIVTVSPSDLSYLEGSGPVPLDDQAFVSDLDNTVLVSAAIDLGSTFIATEDILSFSDQAGITGSFDVVTGLLTLTGPASLADYTTALTSVTYQNTSINPDLTVRIATFMVNDGTENSLIASRNIIIIGTNEPPILVDTSGSPIDTVRFVVNEDEINTLCVLIADPESNSVHIESITSASSDGTFDNGSSTDLCFTFTPALNYNGIVYASLSICDDGSPVSCNSAVVEITVVPVNDAPLAVDDAYLGNEDNDVIGNVLDNDSDPDGDLLELNTTPVDPPVSGTLVLNADGTFSYTPATDFAGQDTFTYSVCDNANPSLCAEAEVTIDLVDVEDAVIAYQLLTPNDDAFNDEWVVDGIEQFPQNNVQIFDRWNALVYKSEGYNNMEKVWKGESNEGLSPDELPDGTYFYVIQLGDGSKPLQGFVELKR